MSRRRISHLMSLFALLTFAAVAKAADSELDNASAGAAKASQIVSAALQAEADGNLVDRDRLLSLAARSDSECAAAQWHRGWLKTDKGQWRPIEECWSAGETSSELSTYEARRDATPGHVLGQWELSRWCLANGFPAQGRAHLARVMELEPDHAGARQLSGFRNVGGEWISAQQQEQFLNRAANVQSGLAKYGKQLKRLAREFNSRRAEVRDEAKDELAMIQDPLAIAPMEAILGTASLYGAHAVVECLTAIEDPEATMSLARFAMFHPRQEVKQAAVSQIRMRPYHDYVPAVLEMLSSPVLSMSIPVVGSDGTLTGFRQAFAQERQSQTDVFVLDTRINYSNEPNPRRARPRSGELPPTDLASQLEAIERSVERADENNARVQASNERIVARNQLIGRFLSEVTEQEFIEPAQIWKWWDETNETEFQSMKPSNIRYRTSALTTRNYNQLAAAAAMASTGPTRAGECFARGTPVITRKGYQAIERVRIGDLVLSRDIPSGELSWKAVVRTTIRPPRPVYEISLDNESLSCTGGHLFWVSGKGWIKASQLRPGDVLHGAAQPVVVMKVVQHPEQETFNLAIDQTQTYFVGKQMILSHDVTDRVPTYIKVPGLSPIVSETTVSLSAP